MHDVRCGIIIKTGCSRTRLLMIGRYASFCANYNFANLIVKIVINKGVINIPALIHAHFTFHL